MDLAEVAAAAEAAFEEFGGGSEVTWILLVAQVAVRVVGRSSQCRLGPVEKGLFGLRFGRCGSCCCCVDLGCCRSGRILIDRWYAGAVGVWLT